MADLVVKKAQIYLIKYWLYRFWCRELNDIVKSQIIVKYTQKKIDQGFVDRNIEYIVVTRYRTKEF